MYVREHMGMSIYGLYHVRETWRISTALFRPREKRKKGESATKAKQDISTVKHERSKKRKRDTDQRTHPTTQSTTIPATHPPYSIPLRVCAHACVLGRQTNFRDIAEFQRNCKISENRSNNPKRDELISFSFFFFHLDFAT